ncbi:leucine-rich repeat domain-containing protein [Aquicella lusitana]|uniref:Leucine rich repeat (LRR) protein n=1 Tax=Aquicella lusitana TaxID=254246 RepID=A0A370GD50_9COXI|nr:hypothetical protein [Aquicella lusitana]RDI41718.1 leucine rich repeat (LRR) protein [Aquicella lusitana]VVC72694.1 hypothetical protein AQULUS_04090 [Aquicella lusitana]
MLSGEKPAIASSIDGKFVLKNKSLDDEWLNTLLSLNPVYLDLSNNDLFGFLSSTALAILETGRLQVLNLAQNKLNFSSMRQLAWALRKNTSLKELDVSGNSLGSDGASCLLNAIARNPNTGLESLNLADNAIDSIDRNIINSFISYNKTLKVLTLDNNALDTPSSDDLTLTTLLSALAVNDTLIKLSLRNINLQYPHFQAMISGLSSNNSLQELDLSGSLSNLSHHAIGCLLQTLNAKHSFTLNLGTISQSLASYLTDNIPLLRAVKLNATSPDWSLNKKLQQYCQPTPAKRHAELFRSWDEYRQKDNYNNVIVFQPPALLK